MSSPPVPQVASTFERPQRLVSVDLLRGLTLAFMILVNDNGDERSAYWALKHAAWNGFTPTDLVFPTFLFLVGITIVLSTGKRLQQGATRLSVFLHIARRALILFLLGLLVNSAPLFHLATLRYYGVLPRIALCYLGVAIFYTIAPGWRSKLIAFAAALAGYYVLMRLVPVPGYGLPGRDIPLLDHDGNLVAWLDRQIFSPAHLYERTRDPEGLLSTLPALGTTLLGVLTGLWLRTGRTLMERARGILVAGFTLILLGGLWNFSFPINKKLWTSSYVLFAGGWSLLLLALFAWLADLHGSPERGAGSTKSGPQSASWARLALLVFGTNAIFAYVLSELLAACLSTIRVSPGLNLQQWLFQAIHAAVPDAAFASLLYSLAYVGICWVVVYFLLYRRRVFLKI